MLCILFLYKRGRELHKEKDFLLEDGRKSQVNEKNHVALVATVPNGAFLPVAGSWDRLRK